MQGYIREKMPEWKTQYDGVETLTLAVMGCVVNGPGESKAANIGISLPGTGEAPNCPVYIDGEHATTLRGTYDELAAAFQKLLDDYVDGKYPRKSRSCGVVITIRAATAADREFVLALAERLADFDRPAWRTAHEIADGDRRALAQQFDTPSPDAALFVAELDGQPAGVPPDVDARGLFHRRASRARLGDCGDQGSRGPRCGRAR